MTDAATPPAEHQPAAPHAPAERQPAAPHAPAEQPAQAPPPEQTECSRAGCRDDAVWAIRWRNPRIHAADRRKTWVACDEHVAYLREFLSARDFPVEVAALSSTRA